jgi:hypothetical protein
MPTKLITCTVQEPRSQSTCQAHIVQVGIVDESGQPKRLTVPQVYQQMTFGVKFLTHDPQ